MLLIASITMVAFLPLGLVVVVKEGGKTLTERARETPLLIGSKGSPLDLVLNSLYFRSETPERIAFRETAKVQASGLGIGIPMYVRFRAGGQPIVGTSVEYFSFRGLRMAEGRLFGMLGECVVGADAAKVLGVKMGGSVISSPENVFDLAGVYPLKMRVAGVLARSYSPDDDAVFVDVKTAWVIEGLGHGHEDVTKPGAEAQVLKREGERVTANASVVPYHEITEENISRFHFHGDPRSFPITAVIAVPKGVKSKALLMGRYQARSSELQVAEPDKVVDELLATVFRVERFVLGGAALAVLSALTIVTLVFLLLIRLRRRELNTMHRIGGSKARIVGMLMAEVGFISILSGLTAWVGMEVSRRYALELVMWLSR